MISIDKLYENQKINGDLDSSIRFPEEHEKKKEMLLDKIREALGQDFADELFYLEIVESDAYAARAYKQGFKDSFQISQEVYQ